MYSTYYNKYALDEGGTDPAAPDGQYLLLVEDNSDDVFLTLRTLRRNDFELPVKVVTDALDTLKILDEAAAAPAAILINYRLPGITGAELVVALRDDERTRSLPIFLITASEEERDRVCQTVSNMGANGCFVKPLRFHKLMSQLGRFEVLPRGAHA